MCKSEFKCIIIRHLLPGDRKVVLVSGIRARDFTFEAHLLAAQGRAITFLLLAGNRASTQFITASSI